MDLERDIHTFPELHTAHLPAEDQKILGSLAAVEVPTWVDTRVEELRRRVDELETHIATLQCLRNAQCAPVSRLPSEVLMRIFGDPSLTCRDASIRRVCRRWRSILMQTAPFWANYIANAHFVGNTPHHMSMLRVGLLHSGALPISLHFERPGSAMFHILDPHRAKIAVWDIELDPTSAPMMQAFIKSGSMARLHTLLVSCDWRGAPEEPLELELDEHTTLPALQSLTVSYGEVTPSMMASSLQNLVLGNIYLGYDRLAEILRRCPSLLTLSLDSDTLRGRADVPAASCTVDLPLLRQLTMRGHSTYIAQCLLRFFTSIPAHALVELYFTDYPNPGEYELNMIPSLPFINRVCLENGLDYGMQHYLVDLSAYVDSHRRVHIKHLGRLPHALRSFFTSPLTVLVVHIDGDRFEPESIRRSHGQIFAPELAHLRRLELQSFIEPSSAARVTIAELFLDKYKMRASELSLAWVLNIDSKQETQSRAEAELKDLSTVLRAHVDSGHARLGRLELYAVEEEESWKPFAGDISAGSDARTCELVVAPFLAGLRELADEVQVG